MTLSLASLFLGALLLVASPAVAVPPPTMSTPLQDQLKLLSEKRIFFAHQSVGQNLLDGLAALAREGGVSLPIRKLEGSALPRPGVVHSLVGRNEDPRSKLQSFEALLAGGAAQADLAMMKLCYVDFTAATDVQALFAEYKRSHESLRARYPGLVLIHVTAPLTTIQGGLKGWLKSTIGMGASGEAENVKRHEFNDLLRQTWGGRAPVFDLAQVESGSGGSACTFRRGGKRWPCLKPSLTDDGGHLNAAGRREAALALVQTLATAVGTSAPRAATPAWP